MEYAQLGNHHGDLCTQIDVENQYDKEQQTLRCRLQRLQQQQEQQQPQQQQFVQAGIQHSIHWSQYETPISTYPTTSDPPAPYSPEDGYYISNSNVDIGYDDAQALMHQAFYGNDVDITNPEELQPRAYDQLEDPYGWQMLPSSVPNLSQLGLPPTTTGINDSYYPVDAYPDPALLTDFSEKLPHSVIALPKQQIDYVGHPGSPQSRGVHLSDPPVPNFEFREVESQWPPQARFQYTPGSITEWFSKNYAARRDPPLSGNIMSEQNGGIWCKICRPYSFIDSLSYRQHKEEIHGIDFKTGFQYWAPLDVRPVSGVVGIGYEGYCGTCELWIPMDLSKPDFNWFHHASRCQDPTVLKHVPKKTKTKLKPANPLDRWSSSEDEESVSIERIKSEAIRMHRQGDFLLPRPPFASNSNSNPSDETNSDIFSSGSSQSVLTSASASNSSVHSAISQHSLESRRKKVLRLRKRKGARSSNQGLRVYQCTFCMADFANFGDWRRHEEVIHLVLDKWVCAPEGQYKNGTRECVYCEEVHAEQSNIPNKCNASYCHGKGPAERVFARKDHLKQHLKRMHGITTWRLSFDSWSQKAKGPKRSRCGFCGQVFDDWQQRMQHIAWEFKNGQKMNMWEGDWGLESTWMMGNKLGNAIMPKSRSDHISKTLKTETDKLPTQQPTPDSRGRVKSTLPRTDTADQSAQDKGKRGLQRKPRLTSLRELQQQQQQEQPHIQTQVVTPPFSWSLPSSASGPQTSPPSSQSPLAPYSTNDPYAMFNSNPPANIQPRPPEMMALGESAGGSGNGSGSGRARRTSQTAQTFQCTYCSTKYTRQDNLRRHMRMHFARGS